VEAVFVGALQVKDLIDHGDFSFSTFEQLDGEGGSSGWGLLAGEGRWQLDQGAPDEAIPF
jgi:acetolactate decarboxylase